MGLFDNFKKKKKEEESTYSNLTLDEIKQKRIEESRKLDDYTENKANEYSKSQNETLNSTTMDLRSWLNENPQAFSVDDNSLEELLGKNNQQTIAESISSPVSSTTRNEHEALKHPSNKKEIIILYRQKDGNMFPDSVAFIDDNGVIIAGPKDYEGKKIEGLREIKSLDEKTFIVWVGHDAYYKVTPEKILKEFNQDSELYKKIYETSKKGAIKCRTNEEVLYNAILSGLMARIGKYKIVFGNRSGRGNATGHFEEFNKDEENIKISLISSFAEQLMKFESIPQFYKDIEPELRKIIQLIESNTLTQQQTTSPKINAEFKHTNNGHNEDDDYFLSYAIYNATPPEDNEENYHHRR